MSQLPVARVISGGERVDAQGTAVSPEGPVLRLAPRVLPRSLIVLYDPRHPSRATTLDHLPGSPRITADGDLEAGPGPCFTC